MIVNKYSNQSQVLKSRCLYYELWSTEQVQQNKHFNGPHNIKTRVMSDVTTV